MADLGAATLIGGVGDDELVVQDGNTVVFGRGDGHDTIVTRQASYTLKLGQGIGPNDVQVNRPVPGMDPRTTFVALLGGVSGQERIEGLLPDRIIFADGSNWDAAEIRRATFTGTEASDLIEGGVGSELLTGQEGDDVITGGSGLDTMVGGQGADTYLFSRTDVQDTIMGDGLDTLKMLDARTGQCPGDGDGAVHAGLQWCEHTATRSGCAVGRRHGQRLEVEVPTRGCR